VTDVRNTRQKSKLFSVLTFGDKMAMQSRSCSGRKSLSGENATKPAEIAHARKASCFSSSRSLSDKAATRSRGSGRKSLSGENATKPAEFAHARKLAQTIDKATETLIAITMSRMAQFVNAAGNLFGPFPGTSCNWTIPLHVIVLIN
jgi:hypothetical protein